VYLRGKYQALVSAAALDAQLTALSTGASVITESLEKQGFPHESMLHCSEFDGQRRAPLFALAR